ncbi:hypothetical protein ACYZT3_28145 [Pseudomonas sp. MDT1-16]
MHYRILHNAKSIAFTVEEQKNRKGHTSVICEYPEWLPESTVESLCSCLVIAGSGLEKSILWSTAFLKALFFYLAKRKSDFPTSEKAEAFILDFFHFYLSDKNHSQSGISTRQQTWKFGIKYFNLLKHTGLIPSSTPIPSSRVRKQAGNTSSEMDTPMGYHRHKNTDKDVSATYLVDVSYTEDSDAYLDNLETELRKRSEAAHCCCMDYWASVTSIHAEGSTILNSDPAIRTIELLKEGVFHDEHEIRGIKQLTHRCSPTNPHYVTNFLATVNYYLFTNPALDSIAITAIKGLPTFSAPQFNNKYYEKLAIACEKILAPHINVKLPLYEVIGKLLGILTARDCAAAGAIMIYEHPQFSPDSVGNAKLYDEAGKSYLIDNPIGDSKTFSVEKKRAKSRKYANLTNLSTRVLEHVIEKTNKIRNRVPDQQSRAGVNSYLFLTISNYGIGVPNNMLAAMNISGITLYEIYIDQLTLAGLNRGDFSYSKIRSTKGILKWFETGSIKSMADELGNQEKAVLRNYIPRWLLKKWNERAQRSFQQLLIILSAYDEPWLLDVTDFTTNEKLQKFILRAIEKATLGDVVSSAINDRFGTLITPSEQTNAALNSLAVNLGEEGLSVLYGYSRWAKSQTSDESVSTMLVGLSDLFQKVSESELSGSNEHTIASMIQGDSMSQLKSVHKRALAQSSNFEKRIIQSLMTTGTGR